MIPRPLGQTGLHAAPLMFGGNVFGWTADRAATFAILDAFVAGGGSLIDTADVYSAWVPGNRGGESETLIGEWLQHSGRRNDVLIATKVGLLDGAGGSGLSAARIAGAVEESLRRLGTVDYDARKLGRHLPQLKQQLPQTLFLGFAVGSGVEMIQFMKAGRSVKALGFVAKKLARHFLDVLRYGEGQQVVRGRALVARLVHTLFDLDVPIWLSSPIASLAKDNGRVTGAEIDTPQGRVTVTARKGVVLACGGYPNDPDRRAATFPAPANNRDQRNPTNPGNTGDGIRLAESVGGTFNGNVAHPAPWMPVSVVPGTSDYTGVWPHLIDRQKPGFIAVRPDGRRFGDESSAYHDLVPQMIRASSGDNSAWAWLIGDAAAVKKWGIGMVRPFPIPHGQHLRNGYLKRAGTLRDLARLCEIDPDALEQTVSRFNANALAGVDPDHGRGGRVYDVYQGDPEHGPNTCLGPLTKGPFYAIRMEAGVIGTFAGLKTDRHARVLDAAGEPVDGLYAVGNDQANVFAGAYPGAGATIGPAMTFAYIAGRHLAGQDA